MACDDLITNQDLENAKKDATTMSDFVESDSPEIQSKNGKNIRTLKGINDAADNLISSLGGTDIGDYEDDLTLNSYNEYVVFDRAGATTGPSLWKAIPPRTPTPGTPLPYTIDSTTYPDPTSDLNIEPFSDINKAGAEQIAKEEANAGDSQLSGGNIWPLSSQKSAQDGDDIQTPYIRGASETDFYEISPSVTGLLSNFDEENNTADIGGVPVALLPFSATRVKNYETIDQALNSTVLKDGMMVKLRSRVDGFGGGHWYVVDTSTVTPNGYNIVQSLATPDLSLVLRITGTAYVPSFIPDWNDEALVLGGITAALNSGAAEVKFGDVTHIYKIGEEIELQPGMLIDFESCIIIASHTTGNVVKCWTDPTGRPVFRVRADRASIGGSTMPNPGLTGLLIDTCNFSRFSGFKFQNLDGFAIQVAATGARDVINLTVEDMEFASGEGLRILCGEFDGVDYEQVTTGRFKDCFFTTSNSGSRAVTIFVNDFSASYPPAPSSGSSCFGLTFERCSMNPVHPDGGTFLYMRATGISSLYNINLENCEGELRYTGTTPTLPTIYMEKVDRCNIEFNGQMEKGNGITLVNSSNNTFSTTRDGIIDPSNTGKFIVLDSQSYNNIFRNVTPTPSQMSTDLGFSNAPLARYWFSNRLEDNGYGNKFEGMIATDVARIFKTSAFDLIDSNGRPVNPSVSGGSTSTVIKNGSGNFEFTMINEVGFRLLVPDEFVGETVVFRCRYRITSPLAGVSGWRMASSVGGTLKTSTMEITDQWNDMMYSTKIDTNRFDIFSNTAQANVVFEISDIEVYLGSFPYPYNINATDVINDPFVYNPYSSTANRPDNSKSTIDIGFRLFDTTLNKPVWWDGANYRDATGTIS